MSTQDHNRTMPDPATSRHWNMLGSISTVCPLDCEFCYRKGNPDGLIFDSSPRQKTVSDIEKTCSAVAYEGKRFDPLEEVGEYFSNKHLIPIIRKFREYFPDELVDFTTSGINLTRTNVEQLSKLGPIFLQVSLNSANPGIRKKIMGDPRPEIAIEGIELLREYGIPFSGTIVAWPTIPEEDIKCTIHYLDELDPVVIKINLPSYTRFFPQDVIFDTFEKWMSLVELVSNVRNDISTPVTWEPFMCMGDPLTPVVTGVVKNSPAARVGIKASDIIRTVDNEPIFFREQARRLLIQRHENDRHREITVERYGTEIEFEIWNYDREQDDRYPHKPPFHPQKDKMFGLFVHQGLDVFSLKRLGAIIEKHKARHVLFLSSFFLAPVTRRLVEYLGQDLFPQTDVFVLAPENHLFGGNIMIGDLLVVSDFIRSIDDYISTSGRPDLVVIPNSPFWNGMDILGVDYRKIGSGCGVLVELLPVQRVMV